MAERSSLNQVVQIGMESTPGTAVTATRRLQSIGFEPSPSVEMDQFRPMGQKYRAITTLGKEWVEASMTGRASFTELVYVLSSVVDTPVVTVPGVTANLWTFTPDSFGDDVPQTFTVEHGSGVRADRYTYGLITEFGMTFNRTNIEVSGSMMGRALEDPFTLTPGATSVDLIPVIPTQVSVYIDDTAAGLGTTKMTRAISADFNLGSRYAGVWVLDAANPSFVNHIETEPDLTMNLVLQADAEGMAFLDTLRDGSTKFIRIEAIGADNAIDTGETYEFALDLAGKVADTGGFSDQDGVYAFEINFVGVHDPTWTKAFEIRVQNTLATL